MWSIKICLGTFPLKNYVDSFLEITSSVQNLPYKKYNIFDVGDEKSLFMVTKLYQEAKFKAEGKLTRKKA